MATPTYIPITTTTLQSATDSVSFFGITQDFRDLVVVANGESTSQRTLSLRVNGDSGSNYTRVRMVGNGAEGYSDTATSTAISVNNWYSGSKTINIYQFMDYSATDKHKSILVRQDDATEEAVAAAARWASTSAISTIELYFTSGTQFTAGTTFAIYGIASEVA